MGFPKILLGFVVNVFVGIPFVYIGEFGFGNVKFYCMVFFVYVCMKVVDLSIVCSSWGFVAP